MLGALVDLLLPRRCAACGAGERLLCATCRTALVLLTGPRCERCGAPTAWPVERCTECSGRRLPFRTARAAVAYDGPARTLVAAWKERGLRALAAEAAEFVAEVVPRPPAAALTFVPGDRERTLWRGANTAEALADSLGPLWEMPVLPLLERAGRTPRQHGLGRGARRANVRKAFSAATAAPAGVAVIDDVYTTGATVSAAATELRRAGAREIHVVTFARAVRR
jgi:predicted amidophosphoribosyltransferase